MLRGVYDQLDAEARQDNENAGQALESAGIRYVEPAGDKVEDWRSTVAGINRRLGAEGAVDAALLDELLGHLETYRALNGSGSGVSATGL